MVSTNFIITRKMNLLNIFLIQYILHANLMNLVLSDSSLPRLSQQEFDKSYVNRYALDSTNTNEDQSWVLVWNDEFDHTTEGDDSTVDLSLSPTKWQFADLGETSSGEQQYYTRGRKENYRITKDTSSNGYISSGSSSEAESATGVLRLTPRKDIVINSNGKKTFTQPAPAIDSYYSVESHRSFPAIYETSRESTVISGLEEVVVEDVKLKYGPTTYADTQSYQQKSIYNYNTQYTSTSISTKNLGANLGGKTNSAFLGPNTRIEARIKLPKGNGLHPMFSLEADHEKMINGGYGNGFPSSGQIDVLESVSKNPTELYYGLQTEMVNWMQGSTDKEFKFYENVDGSANGYDRIWGNTVDNGDSYKNFKGNPTDYFHIYGIEWLSDNDYGDRINFYRNNITMKTYRPQDFGATEDMKNPSTDPKYENWPNPPTTYWKYWPFDGTKNFHIVFKVGLGGSDWVGSVDDANIFDNNVPSLQNDGKSIIGPNDDKHSMMIDWVRVWKKLSNNSMKTISSEVVNNKNEASATIISHFHLLNRNPSGLDPGKIGFDYEVLGQCNLGKVVPDYEASSIIKDDSEEDEEDEEDDTGVTTEEDDALTPQQSKDVCGYIVPVNPGNPDETRIEYPYDTFLNSTSAVKVTIKPNLAGGWFLAKVQNPKINVKSETKPGKPLSSYESVIEDIFYQGEGSTNGIDEDVVAAFEELSDLKKTYGEDIDDAYKLPQPLDPEVSQSLSKYPKYYPKYTLTLPAINDYSSTVLGFQRFGEILLNHNFASGLTDPNWEINGHIKEKFDFYTEHNNGVPVAYVDTSFFKLRESGGGGLYLSNDVGLGGSCGVNEGRWCNQLIQQDVPIIGGRWYTVRITAKFIPRSLNPEDKKFIEGPFVTNTNWNDYKEYLHPVDESNNYKSGYYVPTDKFETFTYRKQVMPDNPFSGDDMRARLAVNIGKAYNNDDDPDGVLIIRELSIVDEYLAVEQRDKALLDASVIITTTTTTTTTPAETTTTTTTTRHPLTPDELCYLEYCNAYDDLKASFCNGEECTADTVSPDGKPAHEDCYWHWRRRGHHETRLSYEYRRNTPQCMERKFNYWIDNQCAIDYCNMHDDLKTSFCSGNTCFITDTNISQAHDCRYQFYRTGRNEIRRATRQPLFPDCLARHVPNVLSNSCVLSYCNAYDDLKSSFCSGAECSTGEQALSCRSHWLRYGKRETQMGKRAYNPTCVENQVRYHFDHQCSVDYCNAYTDLKLSFCSGLNCTTDNHVQVQACREHFWKYGRRDAHRGERAYNPQCLRRWEPYQFSENCALNYCNAYSDLKSAYCNGQGCTGYTQSQFCRKHWYTQGRTQIHRSQRDMSVLPPCLEYMVGHINLPKECVIDYCNSYDYLQKAFCGGKPCNKNDRHQQGSCNWYWRRYGDALRKEPNEKLPECALPYAYKFTDSCALEYCNTFEDLQKHYCTSRTARRNGQIHSCTNSGHAHRCRHHWFRHGRNEADRRDNIPACMDPDWRLRNLSDKNMVTFESGKKKSVIDMMKDKKMKLEIVASAGVEHKPLVKGFESSDSNHGLLHRGLESVKQSLGSVLGMLI